jgi:flagellar export protein FliJ
MARYRFRLAALRRLREIRRDELRARLAEALRAQEILEEQAERLDEQLAAFVDLRRRLLRSGRPDVSQLLEAQRYAIALQTMQRTLRGQREQLATEVASRQLAATDAERDVRVLDKLEEKQRAAHRRAAETAEGRLLDEIGGRRRSAVESEER